MNMIIRTGLFKDLAVKGEILVSLVAAIGLVVTVGCSVADDPPDVDEVSIEKRTNILLILADDMGYSDLGAFGGEIDTPNLDALASDGLIMTNFHVGPTCSVSRKQLFTGQDYRPRIPDPKDPNKARKVPFFWLDNKSETFTAVLNDHGYKNYMVGKWDLGPKGQPALNPGANPMDHGFDRGFWLQNGGGSHYADMRHMLKFPDPTINYYSDRELVEELPEDFYSNNYYTDRLIEFIGEQQDKEQPFFAFASYTAPHWPLHAPEETIAKYADVYSQGYKVVRDKRVKKMQDLGILDGSQTPAEFSSNWPKWEELDPELKAIEIRRMQVHAAMVDSMDENIGRLINFLKQEGLYDNTLILFFSDNGADGNNPADLSPPGWITENFDNSLDNIGLPDSYETIGPNWANVSNTPFKLYKAFVSEGGTRSPFIAVHKDLVKPGEKSDSFASILDIYPTLLDVAGIEESGSTSQDQDVLKRKGKSMLKHLAGQSSGVHPDDHVHAVEYWSRRGVRQGMWKATWTNAPFGSQQWELFNLEDDIAEQADLSDKQPAKLEFLVEQYERYAKDSGVVEDPNFKIRYSNTMNFYN